MNPARCVTTLLRPCLLLLLAGLAAGVPAETLTAGGTGSALEALRRLGSAFAKKEPGFVLSVLPSLGTGGAIKGLGAKSLDLGASSRPLKDSEKALGMNALVCAQTPVVLATSRRSEQTVSSQQLEEIYSGRLARWGDASLLRLVLRPLSETDNQLLMTLSPGLKAALEAAAAREGLATAVTDQDAADLLERLPGSLGTSTLALILSEARPLQVLSLNGVAPWVKDGVNPAYPLLKPLYLVLRDDAKPTTRRFVAFIQSSEGRSILAKIGYSHARP
jgi:phosphate transport system substrate-binding protein